MTIFLVTHKHPSNINYWSGIPFHCLNVLHKEHKVIIVSPGETWPAKLVYWIIIRLKKYFKLPFNYWHSILSALIYIPYTNYLLNWKYRGKGGVVLGLGVVTELLFIGKKRKKVLFCDATFELLYQQSYAEFEGIGMMSQRESIMMERLLYKQLDTVIFTSEWARKGSLKAYAPYNAKTSIAHFGANIKDTFKIDFVQKRCDNKVLVLLLNVTDWKRKGGDYAIRLVTQLTQKSSLKVQLNIVGVCPEIDPNLPFSIVNHGWLNKNKKEDIQLLSKIYAESEFLLLPTNADCTPVSISEAYCFGIPILANAVGGISEMVEVDKTGYIMALDIIDKSTDWILRNCKNVNYIHLSQNARSLYQASFSWDVWLNKINKAISH